MYAKVTSLGVTGLAGYIVQVEADLSGGLPQFNLVGLPDSAVKESSERVRSAIKNLHYEWPASRITINLAPADVRKTGPVYDLPVFVGILAAQGKLPVPGSERAFLGELGLDGTLRPVTGVLPMALAAVQQGVRRLFVPAENAAEAAAAGALCVYPVHTALDAVRHLTGEAPIEPAQPAAFAPGGPRDVPDFADVRGQLEARRAMEIAAAGGGKNINQYFAVLTNTRSVGVMGDGRTYDYTLALRAVETSDFMTADWFHLPWELLDRVSTRIVNEVRGINRVVYDITSKPPATIEWE